MPDQAGAPLVTERPRVVYVRHSREVPPLYDGPPVAPEAVVSVYVVLNGSLRMSAGKAAAQAFHAGWLVAATFSPAVVDEWEEQGRRVVLRVAETQHVFDRVRDECQGRAQQDEGLTEVERGTVTAFVTIPYRRDNAPKILSHKKCQLYTQATAEHHAEQSLPKDSSEGSG